MRALSNLLQCHRTVLAGLSTWNTNFNHLFVSKQTERTATGQHLAPVKVRTCNGVYCAFGVAQATRMGTQAVGKFLYQQRLVTMKGVQAFDAAFEMILQLTGCQVHWDGR